MDNQDNIYDGKLPGNFIAMADQFGAMTQTQAGVISGYYHKLRDDKIPPSLAEQLTMQFAHFLWTKAFENTAPAQPEQTDDPQ